MRKKKQKKSRLPQIVGLTVLFILLFIGFSMLGPQPEIPKPISQAADDFKKNPKIENIIDLTGQQAKAVTDKVGDAAKSAGKAIDGATLPDKAGKLADSAAKGADKLGKQVKQGGDSALVKVSTVWHVEETVTSLRSDPEWVSLQRIPDHTRKALLAIEDHDFYKHGALDYVGIARAAFANLKAGEECSQPCGCQGERSLSSRRSSVLLSCHRLNSKTSPAVPLSGGRKFFDTLKAEAKNEVNGIAGQTKDEWTGFR